MNIQISLELDPDTTHDFEIAEAVRNIADLIDRGFTSGYDPTWNMIEN